MDVLSEEAYESDYDDFDVMFEDPMDDDMEELGFIDEMDSDEFYMDDEVEAFDGEMSDATLAQIAELAESAADAESEEEEDAFLGALAGLAASAAPTLLKYGSKLVPHIAKAAKNLFRRHSSRKAVGRVLSSTVPRVVGRIAQHVARGGRITPRSVMNNIWQTSRGVLCNKHRRNSASRRHKALLQRARTQRYARPYPMH